MINKQEHTPLMDALSAFEQERPISFHVPGHKNGQIFHERGKGLFHDVLKIDATEVEGLDDLHAPEEAIAEAEQLLSELYGTQKSYFLVNGTTCGNLAMILGICEPDDIVLVQRNCHKSVLNGLKLAKATPVFLRNEFNQEWQVAEGLTAEVVRKALEQYSHAKALILTYPSYYGIADHIEEIISVAHEYHVKVLVDEAHGAHFAAGHPFPKSSLSYGADFVVHSAHKTLPALTMGSYLHVNHTVSDYKRVEMYLRMLQSSSPSYPIMASLDLARAYLGNLIDEDLRYCFAEVTKFKKQLSTIDGITVLQHTYAQMDFLKVTIQTDGTFTGIQLQTELKKHSLYSELADLNNVLLICPLLKSGQEYPFEKAIHIVTKVVATLKGRSMISETIVFNGEIEDITELELTFEEMDKQAKIKVPLANAINKIAAETIVPYPPGIPYIIDGEKLSEGKLDYLQKMMELNMRFHGGTYLNEKSILIYA